MSTPRFTPMRGAAGFGWFVLDRGGDTATVAAGPFTSRDDAAAAALRLQLGEGDPAPSVARADASDDLWHGIADTLRSLALQADRYDDAIDGIRAAVNDLLERVNEVEAILADRAGRHSVKA